MFVHSGDHNVDITLFHYVVAIKMVIYTPNSVNFKISQIMRPKLVHQIGSGKSNRDCDQHKTSRTVLLSLN